MADIILWGDKQFKNDLSKYFFFCWFGYKKHTFA